MVFFEFLLLVRPHLLELKVRIIEHMEIASCVVIGSGYWVGTGSCGNIGLGTGSCGNLPCGLGTGNVVI